MSKGHEESLLSESLSLEDLQDEDRNKSTPHEKFGIVNMQNEASDKDLNNVFNVKLNLKADDYMVSEKTKTKSAEPSSYENINSSQQNPKMNNKDVSLLHESSLVSSLNESVEVIGEQTATVNKSKNMEDVKLNLNWVVFDDRNKSNISPVLTGMTIIPPDVPQRKVLSISSVSQLASDSMDMNCQIDKQTIVGEVPPIPDRILSPTSLSLKSTPSQSHCTNLNIRLPPPPQSGGNSFKRQTRTRSSLSAPISSPDSRTSTKILAPPVPPRKDIVKKRSEKDSVSDISKTSDTSSQAWIKFDYIGSSQDELLESVSQCTGTTTPSQCFVDADDFRSSFSSLNTSSVVHETSSNQAATELVDLQTWMSSTPPTSPKLNKKKKKGYHHLSSGSEDEEANSVIETGGEITIEVTDLSPVKPLSQWSRMLNEEKSMSEASSSSPSLNNGHDDLDLDGDDTFAVNLDRLSTDGSVLKGFNRADKGSQNNLVDFSESAEQLDCRSGDETGSSESELETVFDMTAQGDSLKRKRKKKTRVSDQSPSTPAAPISDVETDLKPTAKPVASLEVEANHGPSTNPFWRQSPLGDTISLTSSTSESNPFDRVQFQTAKISNVFKKTTPVLGSNIPTLPPPPRSGKHRTFSGSFSRPRPQKDSLSHSITTSESGNDVEDSRMRASTASSLSESRIVTTTLTQSYDAGLLDLHGNTESDSAPAPSNVDTPIKAKVSCDGGASSNLDSTILETTFEILDGFSEAPATHSVPLSTERGSMEDARELNQLNSCDALHRMMSVDSSNEVSEKCPSKIKNILNKNNLISSKTEWHMLMRFPREKRIMSSRKWVDVFVRLKSDKVEHPTLQLLHASSSQTPFYFIPLDNHEFQVSPPSLRPRFVSTEGPKLEAMDKGRNVKEVGKRSLDRVEYYSALKRKVHCVKMFQTRYKEKRSFATKQDKYMTRVPNGFKHSVRRRQVLKLGTECYADLLSFLLAISDATFKANSFAKRLDPDDHKPTVKFHSRDEIMLEVHDEFMGELSAKGEIEACDVTTHVHVTSFLSGDPMATITFNHVKVQGKEVVRRSDIIPSSNNSWIDMQDIEVHHCSPRGFEEDKAAVFFYPPDACRFELARFHSPYTEGEPPVIVRPSVSVSTSLVSLRCVLRSNPDNSANDDPLSLIPCEDLSIRFSIPDSWVPAFRKLEFGSYKSIHAETATKRISQKGEVLGGRGVVSKFAAIEASIGSGKYEAAYGSVVWRIKRFPEKNAAHNIPQIFSCSVHLASDDNLPPHDARHHFLSCHVEYSMPSCTASNSCIRSLFLPHCPRADKFTCYSARYFYSVRIGVSENESDKQSDCLLQ